MEREPEYYMKFALAEAQKAYDLLEVPVGAVIVRNGEIIASAFNEKESNNLCTSHAEISAIEKASKLLNNWRLSDCDLYVTLEPCPMCAGAIIQARFNNVFIGAMDPVNGACGSITNLFEMNFNYKIKYQTGILAQESETLLKDFFKKLRESK